MSNVFYLIMYKFYMNQKHNTNSKTQTFYYHILINPKSTVEERWKLFRIFGKKFSHSLFRQNLLRFTWSICRCNNDNLAIGAIVEAVDFSKKRRYDGIMHLLLLMIPHWAEPIYFIE